MLHVAQCEIIIDVKVWTNFGAANHTITGLTLAPVPRSSNVLIAIPQYSQLPSLGVILASNKICYHQSSAGGVGQARE